MSPLRMFRATAVILGCLGLILPTPALQAAQPVAAATPRQAEPVDDVALDTGGLLTGQVVDRQGVPLAEVTIAVHQLDQELARGSTDATGHFRVCGLQSGVYQVRVGRDARLLRAWTAHTAPPGARTAVLIVTDTNLIRAQMPAKDFFCSDCLLITGLIAAAIAIPIAVHNSKSSEPSSP